ncbi:hypothetical protein [Arcobacter arenosus]|uniref:HNH endonuclease n=1 Tax=Arcobacter arenosus TaxID=2576037 RepID=A0A5R8Y6C6_9BACT|nr:hypothetical protein [Arcobacter arenosus]TLP41052.1 hypothetical protein FDK22_03260 [Arcobacter arenosus]
MTAPYSKAQQLHKVKKKQDRKVKKAELEARVKFILSKEFCQICGSDDLDYPHHAEFGLAKKDDRTLINICVPCHRHIHQIGFPIHGLSRIDTIKIGWENNEEFINS